MQEQYSIREQFPGLEEEFGGGNKHKEYEQEVLDPINALIAKR